MRFNLQMVLQIWLRLRILWGSLPQWSPVAMELLSVSETKLCRTKSAWCGATFNVSSIWLPKKKKVVNCWAAPSPRRSFMDPLCKYNTLTTLYENVYFHLRTITLCCILCYYNLSKLLPLNDPQKPQVIFPRAFCNPVTSYMCPHSHVPTYSHRDPSRTISFHARLTSSFVYLSTPSEK